MTPQDYNTLATALQERGYHKYKGWPGITLCCTFTKNLLTNNLFLLS